MDNRRGMADGAALGPMRVAAANRHKAIALGELLIPESDICFVVCGSLPLTGLDAVDEIPIRIRDGPAAADAARAGGIAGVIDGDKRAGGLRGAKDLLMEGAPLASARKSMKPVGPRTFACPE